MPTINYNDTHVQHTWDYEQAGAFIPNINGPYIIKELLKPREVGMIAGRLAWASRP